MERRLFSARLHGGGKGGIRHRACYLAARLRATGPNRNDSTEQKLCNLDVNVAYAASATSECPSRRRRRLRQLFTITMGMEVVGVERPHKRKGSAELLRKNATGANE